MKRPDDKATAWTAVSSPSGSTKNSFLYLSGVGRALWANSGEDSAITAGKKGQKIVAFLVPLQIVVHVSKMIPVRETSINELICTICTGKKVGGKGYELRSRGRSSPDTLAF